MRDVFDIYTIIFLALAVFIFLRLRSVLGQRTGRERPPYDPFCARTGAACAGQSCCAAES
jgi:predicted lipid-binding transport protein (Tim44 family)